ncbi:splicing regulator muscleblind isoform X4 [Tachypleus tridentatus]|uniref:splicing regulator muscleblind isoform X4 n=1 Tax=Tachypleus tridentatus TaxID=6853 RepID=UPI003FCF05F2
MIMAMVNNLPTVKDSRWLQLEVCREYQRNKCTRPDTECKFAHPPANVEVQNGRVITCYDSIKGRCNREKPPCKYFHPPQHLKDQLLINGRNHLALKNALLQQMPLQQVLPGQIPTVAATNSYMATLPTMATASSFSPYFSPNPMMGMIPADAMAAPLSVIPTPMVTPQKVPRTDRLEAFPGMVPYTKRPALDKSGLPVYQPSATPYHQALTMQVQQPFVPVSFAVHPGSMPRF